MYANLEDAYSSELKLNKKTVEGCVRAGLEFVLARIEEEPLVVELLTWEGRTIMEIIGGAQGCEYARALYELGARTVQVVNEKAGKKISQVKGYTPIKLKDAPLVGEAEYRQYCMLLEKHGADILMGKERLN